MSGARRLPSGRMITGQEEREMLARLEENLARHRVTARVRGGDLRWYAVHTKARQELRAATELEDWQFGVFYPRVRASVAHGNRKIVVERPFFPRYLFVEVGDAESIAPINSAIGVSTIVHVPNKAPLPIPRGVMDELMGLANEHGLITGDELQRDDVVACLAIGDRVMITRGPFIDFIARLSSINGKHIKAFVAPFGHEFELSMEAGDVKFVGEDSPALRRRGESA